MKGIGILLITFSISFIADAQNPRLDKLEMFFDQGHYKKVRRKSSRLLDDPEYDFSMLPAYYKSISLFQLAQNEYWLLTHLKSLDEAKALFLIVKNSNDGEKILNSHMYELAWLKNDMISWAADLKRLGKQKEFEEVQELIDVLFEEVPEIDVTPVDSNILDTIIVVENPGLRDQILITAKKQLGTPYVWAGSSPDGFDCSGFTSYVMSKNGSKLPRRAVDQYNDAPKVKVKNAQKGDLVFFDNGSGVSHVGIVVSEKGSPLMMIHSSSSKGVIITDVTKSAYWTKRLKGFGTYVD
ncbi:C40 family peptidase [Crocinitomicaceae bacterium]|nr:C40 family peptidase [Crocinitomicaceae bacterium]MDC1196017.1 C40 family peptidase [Crocinitomicaceae bacterium]|tara:strand:+ start:23454 stop:24341 length:888 start_codon:yes stop_codon:yes gene_type:complete